MQNIILISGYGGSGKSTCAELLWEHWGNAALVVADHLFHVLPFDISTTTDREKIGRIKLRNSLALIECFLDEEYSYIVVDGLVWSKNELHAVEKMFGDRTDISLFWLDVDKEERFQRAMKRGDPGDKEEYLEKVEDIFPNPWPFAPQTSRCSKIEATKRDPQEILQEILSVMKKYE